jgi:hypothetical protein
VVSGPAAASGTPLGAAESRSKRLRGPRPGLRRGWAAEAPPKAVELLGVVGERLGAGVPAGGASPTKREAHQWTGWKRTSRRAWK